MKVLIVDDERLARQELKTLLNSFPKLDIIGEAANVDDAVKLIDTLKPDLIFLDIHMPGKSGFDLLNEIDKAPFVIFVTAYDEYAIKAFEVNALDYILKPLDENRLEAAVQKFEQFYEENKKQLQNSTVSEETDNKEERLTINDQVFVKDGEKCWFVKLNDIRLFESEGNYVRVYFNDNKPLILRSLNNLDSKLDSKNFFRANRKFIINLNWVDKMENWFNGGLKAKLKGGEEIEISRRQASKLKDKMSL
jgi:two-component system LytT family response regulator